MRHDENARDGRAAARDGALIRDSDRLDGTVPLIPLATVMTPSCRDALC